MIGDESPHHPDAAFVLDHFHPHAARPQHLLFTEKRLVLSDDNVRNAVQKNGARAHRTWRQCRVHHARAVDGRRLPARAFERIHFTVKHGAPLLHTAVVATSDDRALVNQHRTDRNASLTAAAFGFRDGFVEW